MTLEDKILFLVANLVSRFADHEFYYDPNGALEIFVGFGVKPNGNLTSDPKFFIYRFSTINNVINLISTNEFSEKWDDRKTIFPPIPFTPSLSTEFDGINDHINFGDVHNYDIASAFSIGLWVKPNNTASNRILFSKAGPGPDVDGYMLRHNNDGKIFLQMRSGTDRNHIFASVLTNAVWQFLVFTYSGGSNIDGAKLYYNSVIDAQLPPSGTLSGTMLNGQDFILGSRSGGFFFSGNMYQLTVWNKELTQQEIDSLYNGGNPVDPLEHSAVNFLQGYNPLGDGDTFNIVSDNKNNNDGTMVNMVADDFKEDTP